MSATGIPGRRAYTASHWGVYEVEAGADGQEPAIRGLRNDPDPSPIGLDQFDPQVRRLRVARPSIRQSWLEGAPGAATDKRGREPFVEVGWDAGGDRDRRRHARRGAPFHRFLVRSGRRSRAQRQPEQPDARSGLFVLRARLRGSHLPGRGATFRRAGPGGQGVSLQAREDRPLREARLGQAAGLLVAATA